MVMEAVSLVCQLFGALVLAVNAAPYFWWGEDRTQLFGPSVVSKYENWTPSSRIVHL